MAAKNRTETFGAFPLEEHPMRLRPIAAALVGTASLLGLAVPAGASPNKDWAVRKLPCGTGHKSATLAWSPTHPGWLPDPDVDGGGIHNPHGWLAWYSNPCKGQWLLFGRWEGDPSEDSNDYYSVGTGMSGKVFGVTGLAAQLADAPTCDVDGADGTIIAKDPKVAAHVCDTYNNA